MFVLYIPVDKQTLISRKNYFFCFCFSKKAFPYATNSVIILPRWYFHGNKETFTLSLSQVSAASFLMN